MGGEPLVLQRPAAMRFRTKQEFVYKTLRDAIMRCELVPQQRLVIEDLAREPITEVFELMEGLEIVATRTTAQRMTAKDSVGFDEIVTAMDEALRAGRYEEWADLNSRFHLTISRLSAMPMLHEMTERVLAHWDRLRRYYFDGVLRHRVEQAQDEHRALLAAMRARDLAALEQIVKQHNRGALLAYAEYLKGR